MKMKEKVKWVVFGGKCSLLLRDSVGVMESWTTMSEEGDPEKAG